MRTTLLALSLVALPLPALGQGVFSGSAEKAGTDGGQRTLAGHYFLPTDIVDWPFATTHFAFAVGLGVASGDFAQRDEQGALVDTLGLDFVAFSNALQFQVGILDFLAVRGQAVAQTIGGVNEDAALYAGAFFGYRLGGGVTLTHRLWDRLQIAAYGDVTTGPTYNLNLLRGILNSLERERVTLGNALSDNTTTQVDAGGSFAVGIVDAVGAFGRVGWSHAFESGEASTDAGALTAGGGLSVDLQPFTTIPVGFLGAYSGDFPVAERGEDSSHSASVGVFYTGRANLALGLEGTIFFEPFAEDTLQTYQGIFRIQYIW